MDRCKLDLRNCDCMELMRELKENSIDAIVTDPPYGLSFMGKKWDCDVPKIEIWQECLRILKPGGYLLAFAGTRTQHRMACRIEDAGFEIRDMIAWVYGSGFPKSLNIGKAVDKIGNLNGVEIRDEIKELIIKSEKSDKEISIICNVSPALVRFWRLGERTIQKEEAEKLKTILNNLIPEKVEREVIGLQEKAMSGWKMDGTTTFKDRNITKGTSEWEGWGTALKPALEPITVARKPLSEKTVAENILKYGTGGINIDGCRVPFEDTKNVAHNPLYRYKNKDKYKQVTDNGQHEGVNVKFTNSLNPPNEFGRFPANLIHDGSDEVVELFPNTKSGKMGVNNTRHTNGSPNGIYGKFNIEHPLGETYGDAGSAARFFYCAKASKSERNIECDELAPSMKNNHPTVKPIALMEYLIKLVSREGATVLDPFMGSGTTGIACIKNNRNFIGSELDKEYYKISSNRIKKNKQLELF